MDAPPPKRHKKNPLEAEYPPREAILAKKREIVEAVRATIPLQRDDEVYGHAPELIARANELHAWRKRDKARRSTCYACCSSGSCHDDRDSSHYYVCKHYEPGVSSSANVSRAHNCGDHGPIKSSTRVFIEDQRISEAYYLELEAQASVEERHR
jgi:hypothetical protein